uniref:Uncharacterized protein n=1 Tax=Timema monikensis TaxID=170555 RepID=A0A7R9E8K5_9NEOP|nr:unnamed protein product [Timema monikensis]
MSFYCNLCEVIAVARGFARVEVDYIQIRKYTYDFAVDKSSEAGYGPRTCLFENMCSLDNFPRLPPEGEIVVCEMNGQVHSMNYDQADAIIFTTSLFK